MGSLGCDAPPPVPRAESTDALETIRLGERTLLVRAGGNNVLAVAGEHGLAVIDTGSSPELGRRVARAVREAFDRDDILYVVNTHDHWDHTWGNQAFAGITIVGHDNCPAAMRRVYEESRAALEAPPASGDSSLPPPPPRSRVLNAEPGVEPRLVAGNGTEGEGVRLPDEMREAIETLSLTPPTETFDDRLRLDLGGVSLELVYYGSGHSASDVLVLVPEASLLATGDLFWKGQLPPLAGAEPPDPERWLFALDRVIEAGPLSYVVPGHGERLDYVELLANRAYIATVWNTVRELRDRGETLDRARERLALERRFPELAGLDVEDDRGGSLHRSNVVALWQVAGDSARIRP
jgi:glyoxylase-like metal-dependent hydrolase (beta-lactamase superfamily II)